MDANKGPRRIVLQIAIAICVSIVAWIFIPSFWFWTGFEFFSGLLVVIGCAGEWYLHHHPAGRKRREQDEHHKIESRYIGAVVFGVVMEVIALGHTIKEGVSLERYVATTKSTNLWLSAELETQKSNNFVLRSNVVVLEAQLNMQDLRQKPVISPTAFVHFQIDKHFALADQGGRGMLLAFMRKNDPEITALLMQLDSVNKFDNEYFVHFKWHFLNEEKPFGTNRVETSEEIEKGIGECLLTIGEMLPSCPPGAVTNISAVLTLNPLIQKRFSFNLKSADDKIAIFVGLPSTNALTGNMVP